MCSMPGSDVVVEEVALALDEAVVLVALHRVADAADLRRGRGLLQRVLGGGHVGLPALSSWSAAAVRPPRRGSP